MGMVMAMEDMDTMDTMVRGQLMQSQDMATMVMDMVMGMDMVDMVMDTMDIMARDLLMLKLSQLPLLNQVMDIMAMDMDTILDMAMDTTDTMERDLLKPNQDMDTMAMDMDMDMVMVMVMAMVMDTMDKSIFMLLPR